MLRSVLSISLLVTMEGGSWQFVQVDPLAPKKRRKKRLLDSSANKRARLEALASDKHPPHRHWTAQATPIGRPPRHAPDSPAPVNTTWTTQSDPVNCLDDTIRSPVEEAQHSEHPPDATDTETAARLDRSQLDDFDRYCLYSNGRKYQTPTASTMWCSLGVNIFFVWTPLASGIIENSLFHYCKSRPDYADLTSHEADATESVSASVSFDGPYNLFRIALLPLVSSEPVLFHGAIAVASIHWANKLKGVRRNVGQLDERSQQQLEILQLASKVSRMPGGVLAKGFSITVA